MWRAALHPDGKVQHETISLPSTFKASECKAGGKRHRRPFHQKEAKGRNMNNEILDSIEEKRGPRNRPNFPSSFFFQRAQVEEETEAKQSDEKR